MCVHEYKLLIYYRFDKVVSDVYLIDIVWRVSVSMIAEGTLFKGKLPSVMDKDTFVFLISSIANNKYAKKMFNCNF